jgi:hypothetical protein
VYSNNWFAFYKYAQDANDSLYSWGRSKALVLGNGFSNLQEASSPDAMDVLTPTMVHPLSARYQTYNFTAPVLNAGADQSISTATTTLTATGHPAAVAHAGTLYNGIDSVGYRWVSFQWTKISGPACTITSPTLQATTVSGMTNGVYQFRIIATDNNTGTIVDTVKVTVDTSGGGRKAIPIAPDVTAPGSTAGQLLVYPTVTRGSSTTTIAISSDITGPVKIRVLDLHGKVLQTIQSDKRSRYFSKSLHVDHLPAGLYIVQALIGNSQQFTAKFIRQ